MTDDKLNLAPAYWERGWFWLALALVSTLPFVVAPMPMMPDHFAHVARYHVMLDHALNEGQSEYLSRYFSFQWAVIANLGVDLLMVPLGRLLPLEPAATLAAALIPALLVLGIYALAKSVYGRVPATALFALTMVWTHTFLYGFENYWLSVALGLLCAAAWIRLGEGAGWRRWLLMAPFSMLVWLAHLSGWGTMGLFVLGWEMSRVPLGLTWRGYLAAFGTIIGRMLPLALPLALLPLWRDGNVEGAGELILSAASTKLRYLLDMFRGEILWLDYLQLGLVSVLAIYLLVRLWRWRNRAMVMATGLQLSCFLFLPFSILGTFFVDVRLLPVVGIAFFLALPEADRRRGHVLALAALALFGTRVAEISYGWFQRGQEMQIELLALEQIPRGSRVVSISRWSNCNRNVLHGFDHVANFVITRRDGFANTQWDVAGAQLMRPLYNKGRGYNDADSGQLKDTAKRSCNGRPLGEIVDGIPRDRFDFVWSFDAPVSRPWLRQVFAGPHGRLYRIEPAG